MSSVADQYAQQVAHLLITCEEGSLLTAIKDEIEDECKFIAIYEEMEVNGRKHEDLMEFTLIDGSQILIGVTPEHSLAMYTRAGGPSKMVH